MPVSPFTATLGDSVERVFTLTHHRGSADGDVSVREVASGRLLGDGEYEVEFLSTAALQITFATAPATASLVVTFLAALAPYEPVSPSGLGEFLDDMAEGLTETQAFLGTVPFFWAGRQLAGDFSKLDETYDVEEGGRQIKVTATLFAARAQFLGSAPKKGHRVKVGADFYEIAHVEGDPLGLTMFLGADIRRQA